MSSMIEPDPRDVGTQRTAGARGDTTTTFYRSAQDKLDKGGSIDDGDAGDRRGGLLGWLGRLWPFGRRD